MSNSDLLFCRNLAIKYDETPITYPDFSLGPGEMLLIKGDTASGKTSLLNTIVGSIPRFIDARLTGDFKLHGREPYNTPLEELSCILSYVPQEPWDAIITHMVETEILVSEATRCTPNTSNNVPYLFPELKKLYHLPVFLLSGGETRKLALETRISRKTPLYVLDEPFSFLDYQSRKRLVEALKQAVEEGSSIVIAEHEPGDVAGLASRIVELKTSQERRSIIELTDILKDTIPHAPGNPRIHMNIREYTPPLSKSPLIKRLELDFKGPGLILVKGPNGSGKTTLLRILSGLLKAKGEVRVVGKHILVPDNPLLYYTRPTLSEELRGVTLPRILKDKRLAGMSSGERRIGALISALNRQYDIIMLDEPTLGLDYQLMETMKKLIEYLKERILFIVATHSGFLEAIADETVDMGAHSA